MSSLIQPIKAIPKLRISVSKTNWKGFTKEPKRQFRYSREIFKREDLFGPSAEEVLYQGCQTKNLFPFKYLGNIRTLRKALKGLQN